MSFKVNVVRAADGSAENLWILHSEDDTTIDYPAPIPSLPTLEEAALQINAETTFKTLSLENRCKEEPPKTDSDFDDFESDADETAEEASILSRHGRESFQERSAVADFIEHSRIDCLFEMEDMRGIFFKFEPVNDEHGRVAAYTAKIVHIDASLIGSKIILKMLFIANAHVKGLHERIIKNNRVASADKVALAGQNRTLRVENQSLKDLHETFVAMHSFEQSKNKVLTKQLDVIEGVLKQLAAKESWEPATDGRNRVLILNNELDGGYTLCQAALDHPIMKA
jgi:hypothetical protein